MFIYLLLSLAAHAVAFIGFERTMISTGAPSQALRVTLLASRNGPAGLLLHKTGDETRTNGADNKQRARLTARNEGSSVDASTDQKQGHNTDSTTVNGLDEAVVKSRRVRARLSRALVAHFTYPSLARQRGWQGEVRLGLRIEANGDLTRVRVLESSGYGILDRAALRSLQHIRSLPEAIALLEGNSLDLILPVRFQLLGG
jgi:TonB family protein